MGKASGLLLVGVAAGLGIAYVAPWEDGFSWDIASWDLLRGGSATQRPALVTLPNSGDAAIAVAPDGWRAFAKPTDGAPRDERSAAAEPAPRPAPVVVMIAPRPSEPARAPSANSFATDRVALARELQRELKRVGCYEGEISGVWSPLTRSAMKAFTGRVNAALPVEEPDVILLTLVQGQQDKVCGQACPAGQGVSADGRCLPNAILAQSARKPQQPRAAEPVAPIARPGPVITGWSTSTTAAAPTPPLPPGADRMALAGPANTDPASLAAVPGAPLPVPGVTPPKPVPPKTATTPKFGPQFFRQLDRQGGN